MILKEAPTKSTRHVADLLKIGNATVSRARTKLAGVSNGTPETIKGRDGKTYHYPATSVENPSVARIAGQILNELGEDAPEGGASLRTLNKKRFELERDELLDRTSPSLPKEFKLYHRDFRKLGSLIEPGSVRLVVSDPPWLKEHEDLRQPFAETVARILKPGGFACVYTGHFHLKEFMDALCGAGLEYRWLIACVNDDTMGAIRSSGSILTFWRPVLLFQKPGGKAKTPRILRDLIQGMVQKPPFSGITRDLSADPDRSRVGAGLRESLAAVLGFSSARTACTPEAPASERAAHPSATPQDSCRLDWGRHCAGTGGGSGRTAATSSSPCPTAAAGRSRFAAGC